ncbi:formate dehydrogenase accessory protein FdhE [Megalodesulfovibrio paquesii]
MKSMNDSPSAARLLADAATLSRELPELKGLIESVAPLLAARAELLEALPGWQGPLLQVEEPHFCQGNCLLAESGFQALAPLLPLAAQRLLPAMTEAYPGLTEELGTLQQGLEDGTLPFADLETAALDEQEIHLAGVSPEVLRFAAWQLVKPLLERQAQDLASLIRHLPWTQATCPICGGGPDFSRLLRPVDNAEFITAHGGARHLRCATCATEWKYKRISCPACGNEEPSTLTVLRNEARPGDRVDACDVCKAYLLCLDASDMIDIPNASIAMLAMLPLDLRARQAGYTPMALQPWELEAQAC